MADDLQQHSLCLLFAVCVRVHCAVLGEQSRCRHRFRCGWVAGCVSSCYGGHSVEETPGSIPNPEAKLDRADGTALGRVWESRSPPDIFTGSGGVLEPLFGCSPPPLPFFMPGSRASAFVPGSRASAREQFRGRGRAAVMRSRGVHEPGGAHEFPGREPASRCHELKRTEAPASHRSARTAADRSFAGRRRTHRRHPGSTARARRHGAR